MGLRLEAQRGTALDALPSIVAASVALGALSAGGPLSRRERQLVDSAPPPPDEEVDDLARQIRSGADPLGDALCAARSIDNRRRMGSFYTPLPIVRSMVTWAVQRGLGRFVDAGCGSGRFSAQATLHDPDLQIVAIDTDPVATLACRATLRVIGAKRAQVVNGDYTTIRLEAVPLPTAFVGNPPYVRHHDLSPQRKRWARRTAMALEIPWSGLAGLHAMFFLATLRHGREGDVGCFITSAEWLDVGYGKGLRAALLDGLGGLGMHRLDPEATTFRDAMATAVVTCFQVGASPRTIRIRNLRSPDALGKLDVGGRLISRSRFEGNKRWTPLFAPSGHKPSGSNIRLGDVVKVSRGAVTGHNKFFVLTEDEAATLGLVPYTVPVVAAAKDVFDAEGILRERSTNQVLLDPPRTLDLTAPTHAALRRYLRDGERMGVRERYICRHRTPWWHVGAKHPPLLATYMARQPPAFALNPDRLAILNVLHGLFPREDLDPDILLGLVHYLNAHREGFRGSGRVYQGGLEKFEPREMEELAIPPLEELARYPRG